MTRNRSPAWLAPAGFALLFITIAFLMALVVGSTMGYAIPCSGRGLVVFIIALTTGAAAGFLSGSAKASGQIPFLGGSVVQIAASGAIAAILVVAVVGFRLYASTDGCSSVPQESGTEKATAIQFWRYAMDRNWRAAYDMFPPMLHEQMPFTEFVSASTRFLSQFPGQPKTRHIEDTRIVSGTLTVQTLAQFDQKSTFRETLVFQRHEDAWIPWSFITNPLEWPQANSAAFVTLSPTQIISDAGAAPLETRREYVQNTYAGKYVPNPGWSVKVGAIGERLAEFTCDVTAREQGGDTPIKLAAVLGGCVLTPGAQLLIGGRIRTVEDSIVLDAVRFYLEG